MRSRSGARLRELNENLATLNSPLTIYKRSTFVPYQLEMSRRLTAWLTPCITIFANLVSLDLLSIRDAF